MEKVLAVEETEKDLEEDTHGQLTLQALKNYNIRVPFTILQCMERLESVDIS